MAVSHIFKAVFSYDFSSILFPPLKLWSLLKRVLSLRREVLSDAICFLSPEWKDDGCATKLFSEPSNMMGQGFEEGAAKFISPFSFAPQNRLAFIREFNNRRANRRKLQVNIASTFLRPAYICAYMSSHDSWPVTRILECSFELR